MVQKFREECFVMKMENCLWKQTSGRLMSNIGAQRFFVNYLFFNHQK